jgi:hypothetical protein
MSAAMSLREHLLPADLVTLADETSREEFIDHFQGDKLFLVALGEHRRPILEGLQICAVATGMTWFPRSEPTGTGTSLGMGLPLSEIQSHVESIPPSFDDLALRDVLLEQPSFALPVRKRPGSQILDPERISVGRSRANDVVLFHPSVSKLHAYLEHDDRDRFYVCDAGSTNFTRVRGRLVDAHETVNFALGDPLQFGDVEVRIVDSAMIWDVVRG